MARLLTMGATRSRRRWLVAGITLIEVMIAVAVLAASVAALTRFQTGLTASNALAKQRGEAAMLGQQKIDDLRRFSSLAAYAALASGSDQVVGTNATFDRRWTVTRTATPPLYADVSVSVTWTTAAGEPQTATLNTAIASHDPVLTARLITNTTAGGSPSTTSTSSTSSTSSSSSTTTTTASPTTTTTATTPTTTTTTTNAGSRTITADSTWRDCTSSAAPCAVTKKSTITVGYAISPYAGLTASDIVFSVNDPQAATSGSNNYNPSSGGGAQNITVPSGNNQAFTVTITVTGAANPLVLYFVTSN